MNQLDRIRKQITSLRAPAATSGGTVRSFLARRKTVVRVFAVLLGLAAWQFYSMGQPQYLFPTLETIFDAFVQQVTVEDLVGRFIGSVTTLFAGFLIAVVVGIAIGFAIGMNRFVDVMLNPYVNAFYVAPIAALVPVFIAIGGASFYTRVAVVFLFAVFEIIVDTSEGIKAVPEESITVAESFGAGKAYVMRNVILPFSLPYIFTGIRLGIGRAVKGMILAELLFQYTNLGALIQQWSTDFQIAGVLSVVIVLVLLGIVLTRSVSAIEHYVVDWKHTEEH